MSFKVAFIGAGSIGFTRSLLRDLFSVPEFHDIEVALPILMNVIYLWLPSYVSETLRPTD